MAQTAEATGGETQVGGRFKVEPSSGGRQLHVMPTLYFPYEGRKRIVGHGDLRCRVFLDDVDVTPGEAEGWRWTRPFPNGSYFVFGTAAHGCGFFLPLDEGVTRAELLYEWHLPTERIRVLHEINLDLEETGRGEIFSTDVPAPGGERSAAPLHTVTARADLEAARAGHGETFFDQHHLDRAGWELVCFSERAGLPSAGACDTGLIGAARARLSRPRRKREPFRDGDALHLGAAEVHTADPRPLVEAVRLAREVPFGGGTEYDANWEAHPALARLCGWWNATAPGGREARALMPWVRVGYSADYWCGDGDEWTRPGRLFHEPSCAAFGDLVIVAFLKGRDEVKPVEGRGYKVLTADGHEYEYHHGDPAEAHPAREALAALRDFPERFPATWAALGGEPVAGGGSGTPGEAPLPDRAAGVRWDAAQYKPWFEEVIGRSRDAGASDEELARGLEGLGGWRIYFGRGDKTCEAEEPLWRAILADRRRRDPDPWRRLAEMPAAEFCERLGVERARLEDLPEGSELLWFHADSRGHSEMSAYVRRERDHYRYAAGDTLSPECHVLTDGSFVVEGGRVFFVEDTYLHPEPEGDAAGAAGAFESFASVVAKVRLRPLVVGGRTYAGLRRDGDGDPS